MNIHGARARAGRLRRKAFMGWSWAAACGLQGRGHIARFPAQIVVFTLRFLCRSLIGSCFRAANFSHFISFCLLVYVFYWFIYLIYSVHRGSMSNDALLNKIIIAKRQCDGELSSFAHIMFLPNSAGSVFVFGNKLQFK